MADLATSSWPAPAKLNRFLHITGRRADGYHLLQTVFQFLDYSDQISFNIRQDQKIRLLTPVAGVEEADNLVIRAARRLQQLSGSEMGADISLQKLLPMGGGLGGGSSNAATVLVALNYLWQTGYHSSRLAEIGLELGADVPVFVHGQATWAEGVGEKFQAVTLDEPWFCVIVPPVHVSTAAIFSDPELTRNSRAITISDFLNGEGTNDCEALVVRRYKEVAEVIQWLKSHVDTRRSCVVPTRMTGTGACVFVGLADKGDAEQVSSQLPAGWNAFVARGVNQSPLHKKLTEVMSEHASGTV